MIQLNCSQSLQERESSYETKEPLDVPNCLYLPPHGTKVRSVGTGLKLLIRGIDRNTSIASTVTKNGEIGCCSVDEFAFE